MTKPVEIQIVEDIIEISDITSKELIRIIKQTGRENALLKRRLILIEEELKKRRLFDEFKGLV